MTLRDVAQHRLINQQIATTNFQQPAQIVGWLGAMQAQEYSLSKWAIGLRLPGCKDDDIEAAFTNGDILRTHLLRPTWHFVTSADISWLLALTSPRVNAVNAFMYRKTELDSNIFNKANDVFAKELQGGKQLTRDVLRTALSHRKIIADGVRLSCIMMRAELDGIICSGARYGRQFTYALLDERVPPFAKLNDDEALAELTKRYFNSRGPAALNDFATWSGLTNTQVKKGIAMVADHFRFEKVGDEVYYFPSFGHLAKKMRRQAFLLPPYDEYIMGYKNREAIFLDRNKVNPAAPLSFDNTIIFNGQVAGSWRRTFEKNSISIEYHLYNTKTKKQLILLKQAVGEFSRFMNLPVSLINKA